MALTELAKDRISAADELSPGLPAFSRQTRLLVVAPHPDDETIATGLLIQQVRAAGGEVQILLLTTGDNNPWPQRWLERRVRIGAADRLRWGGRRLQEMREALQQLGLPSQALHSLGWRDLGLTDEVLRPGSTALATLSAVLAEFGPNLMALPALDDRHPDHSAAHVLVRLALAIAAMPAPSLLTYLVHGNAAAAGGFTIEGTAEQSTNKLAALMSHRSQLALSGGRMRRLAVRPERYCVLAVRPSGLPPVLPWRPPAFLQPWLLLGVASAAGAQAWRWQNAPLARDHRGGFQIPPADLSEPPRFVRLQLRLSTPWIFDHWGWCEI